MCLMTMAQVHGLSVDPRSLQHEFGSAPFTVRTVLLAARKIGLKAAQVRQNPARLDKVPTPCIGLDKGGAFFVLVRVGAKPDGTQQVFVHTPGQDAPTWTDLADFKALWSGELLLFTSARSVGREAAIFDFSWFIPAVVKYRRLFGEILLVSLVLQIIGLITPLFFQVVMDKVLVNHAMKTLNVIAIGLVAATLFEVVLGAVRSWVFAHTSSKIDVELGARLFRHLLSLPSAYFGARRVGDSVARVRELENIRSFLTGNAMTVVLDLVFSFVFIAVMYWYSPKLTFIVAASIPLYVIISLLATPVIRDRLNDKFNKGAENQSFLVESISGIDTVKAMAVEPRWIGKFEQQLAGYVQAGLSATNVSTVSSAAVTLVSKLVTAGIMWMGATLVIDGQMTVGELVAFNMLASQVSNPILRLAQLWNDFQQVGISMSRLGDILNAQGESEGQKTRLPRLSGAITFDQVSFRYRSEFAHVLRNVSVDIRAGEVIGIVGRSGSGKSTLTKLIQRLYAPERGRVLIDGQDLSVIDTPSLRHQIGVVLQENVLFNRSVRDNIALVNPALPIEAIVNAAKMAGAHEFICEMPEGYDSMVGEHGAGLSGGQRQRIAIARALISDPRILIFDEATSALDYESEKIIQDNMRTICRGRTVLIIAHRLSAVRDADRILVIDKGEIVEVGSHHELLRNPNGIYTHLHSLQQGPDDASAQRFAPGHR